MRIRSTLFVMLAFAIPAGCFASEIYRTVDEEGHVTYTDTPGSDAVDTEIVEQPPKPSSESAQQTRSRTNDIVRRLKREQHKKERAKQKKNTKTAKAEAELKAAQERLQTAREMRAEDRQKLVGGGTKIRPEYFERIRKLEAEVDLARQELKKVRGY